MNNQYSNVRQYDSKKNCVRANMKKYMKKCESNYVETFNN